MVAVCGGGVWRHILMLCCFVFVLEREKRERYACGACVFVFMFVCVFCFYVWVADNWFGIRFDFR